MKTVCQLDIFRYTPGTFQAVIFGNNRQRLMP